MNNYQEILLLERPEIKNLFKDHPTVDNVFEEISHYGDPIISYHKDWMHPEGCEFLCSIHTKLFPHPIIAVGDTVLGAALSGLIKIINATKHEEDKIEKSFKELLSED